MSVGSNPSYKAYMTVSDDLLKRRHPLLEKLAIGLRFYYTKERDLKLRVETNQLEAKIRYRDAHGNESAPQDLYFGPPGPDDDISLTRPIDISRIKSRSPSSDRGGYASRSTQTISPRFVSPRNASPGPSAEPWGQYSSPTSPPSTPTSSSSERLYGHSVGSPFASSSASRPTSPETRSFSSPSEVNQDRVQRFVNRKFVTQNFPKEQFSKIEQNSGLEKSNSGGSPGDNTPPRRSHGQLAIHGTSPGSTDSDQSGKIDKE